MRISQLLAKLQAGDKVAAAIAALALLVSVVTFLLTYRDARRTAILSRKPILIFEYDGSKGWILRNVGSGPALNVVVAQIRRVDPDHPEGDWFNPVRVPPISKDGAFELKWLDHVNTTGLGVTYTDFESLPYTSTCGNDLSRVYEGARFGGWREEQIGRWWNHPIYHD